MLKISDLSVLGLLEKKFEKQLPELYDLCSLVENNDSHFFDPVFHHCVVTFQSMQTLLSDSTIFKYFSSSIENHSKADLLLLAALFHDIGKKGTQVQNGLTVTFPGHEENGFKIVIPILKRFDLSLDEQTWVAELVKNHGKVHELLKLNGSEFEEKLAQLQAQFKSIFPELCLLTWADVLGSQLLILNPKKFEYKVNFCKSFLEKV